MTQFIEFLETIENPQHREKLQDMFQWIETTYPELESVIKWNQPMYTHHGTFILGFSVAKPHIAIAPEKAGMMHFTKHIKDAGYDQTMMLFKIKWNQIVDYDLLRQMIDYNIREKASITTFWR